MGLYLGKKKVGMCLIKKQTEPTLESFKDIIITKNGIYRASDEGVSGYKTIKVDVGGTGGDTATAPLLLQEKIANQNGEYLPDEGYYGFGKFIVDVPSEDVVLQDKTVVPTKERQVVTADEDYTGLGNLTIEPIPDEYIVPEGTLNIDKNGSYNVKDKESVNVEVPGEVVNLQDKSVTPTKEPQNVSADEGYTGLGTVEVDAIPDEYIIPIGSLEVTENNTYDVTDKASVVVNVPSSSGGGKNGLQWKCDNMKSLAYEFYQYTGSDVQEALQGLDTSQVTSLYFMCNDSDITSLDLSGLELGNVYTIYYMLKDCSKLTTLDITGVDFGKVSNGSGALMNCQNLTSIIGELKFPSMTNANSMFSGCSKLTILDFHNSTGKVTNIGTICNNCSKLVSLLNIDLESAGSLSNWISGCTSLQNLTVRNIKKACTLWTSSSKLDNLTIDSLVNVLQQAWDYSGGTSTYKLIIGPNNLAKLENVYVKLITPTSEQIAEDPNINSKKPCVVCESVDEGAMRITEYATSKMWVLS